MRRPLSVNVWRDARDRGVIDFEGEIGAPVEMLEITTDGAGAAVEAVAVREDEGAVGELGFGGGGRGVAAGVPDPELVEQAKRRTFTAEYKAKILARADACSRPGEIGELLRREGLYTSHLTYWRKQRKEGALRSSAGRAGASRSTGATRRSAS